MRAVLALLLLLLAGCAERWTRPGGTEAEADAANAACRDRAALAVPPQMIWQMVSPPREERERRCTRHGQQETCHIVTRRIAAQYGWVDANAAPRDAWRRDCMRGQGFRFEGYRPLRLFGTEDAPPAVDAPSPEG